MESVGCLCGLDRHTDDHHWLPGAVICATKQRELYFDALVPCTMTLYDWIDR
ncbi:hypothetical protein [Salinicoccus roseus]|uniref:hypothetical protein n=1 Tax=Salinicoccus roseus TaxID=45670 RepID=UPI00230175A6|nr:hypothetical protein [Salinicoccus roseus]